MATDKYLADAESLREILSAASVDIRCMDVKDFKDMGELFNIVTLNAPIIQGKNNFVYEALELSERITTRPGLMLLRLAIASDDVGFDPFEEIRQGIPLYEFDFPDLPITTFTNHHVFVSLYLPPITSNQLGV